MNFMQIQAFGWRARAAGPRSARTGSQALQRCGRAAAAAMLAALVWTSADEWASASAFLNRLEAIHVIFGAGIMSVLLLAGLNIVSGAASVLLAVAEFAPRLALGGAMMGVLPFAQAADAPKAKPAPGDTASVARSEMQVGLYMGKSLSPPSDVKLVAPDGTDMILKDVVWKPESFKPSPYYGGRGVDWNSRLPALGLMVDFTHAKATAIRSQTLAHTGMHKGEKVPPRGPFNAIFRKLEFTHGLNFLTLNGVYRAAGLHRRIVPYAGVGIGFMMPHAEARRAGQDKKDAVQGAQLTGIVYQLLAGIEWRVFKSDRRSIFTEYKLSYTTNDVKLRSGGLVTANILVHQFNFGGYYTPWRQGAAAAK